MIKQRILIALIVLWLVPLCAAWGQGKYVERKIEALAITPLSFLPDSRKQIVAYWSADAVDIGETQDLSTNLTVLANGRRIFSQDFNLLAEPSQSTAFGCDCPPEQLCWVLDGIPIGCGEPPLVCDPGFPGIAMNDEITIQLNPLPGALPDSDPRPDSKTTMYEGGALLAVDKPTGGIGSFEK